MVRKIVFTPPFFLTHKKWPVCAENREGMLKKKKWFFMILW